MTRIPARSATITVRVSNRSPTFGSVKPTASNSEKRPLARSSPRKSPTTEATTPTTNDSRMTDVRTWRREAPRVRSVANSRIRCAIVMESEFAITKEPTKSAIPPNASRKPWRNVMNSFVSEASSSAWASPLTACAPWGRIGRISPSSSSVETPGLPATAISSSRPSFSKSRCAVGRSNPARVAPPIERFEPNSTIPEIRSVETGPST